MKKRRWKTLPYLLTVSMMFTGMTAVCAGAETFPAVTEADLFEEDMLPAAEETVQEEEILYQEEEEIPEETDVLADPSLNPDEEYADDDPVEEETPDTEEADEEAVAEEDAAEAEDEVSDEEAASSAVELPAPDQAERDEAAAAGPYAEGKCGPDLTYSLSASGVLTISGTGRMYDYMAMDPPWLQKKNGVELREKISRVIIEDGVTTVCKYAFNGCTQLTYVKLADSITSMDNGVFYGCYNISRMTFPKNLKTINSDMLFGCSTLERVTLPSGLKEIGSEVFRQCSSLREVTIPSGVTVMGDGVFRECTLLTTVTIPSGVKKIGSSMFESCVNLKTVSIPSGVTSIGSHAFMGCKRLEEIKLPAKLTKIEMYTFYFCKKLKEVNVPQNVTEIGANAFDSCTELVYLILPVSLKTIRSDAFANCKALNYRFYMGTEKQWSANVSVESGNTAIAVKNTFYNPFKDVPQTSPFVKGILWAASKKITSGMTATQFKADDLCTRGQIVTFLWRAYGEPKHTMKTSPFKDVKKGSAFYDAVLWAYQNGIASGVTSTKFGVDTICTRGQAVTFMYRSAGSPVDGLQAISFTDISSASYCYYAVRWAVTWGITNGVTSTQFGPEQSCTRGQIVTFLFRYLR
ncbi:MAG: leucine-rich repeat protein [Lachnospiraceae bacterium]|nr:leucine-rich repeat protein [Lachnospiraceae bacterium]